MRLKDEDRMANGVNHEKTAPSRAVWSGLTLFTQHIKLSNRWIVRDNYVPS